MANQLDGSVIQQTQNNFTSASPTAAQGAGKSPDQAKMSGTPAARQGATRSARILSEKGAGPMVSAEQKAAAERASGIANSLKAFGSLGNRVTGLINQRLNNAVVQAQASTAVTDEASKEWQKKYLTALSTPSTTPGKTPEDILESASVALGKPVEALEQVFTPAGIKETLKAAYTAATPDKITLGDLAKVPGSEGEADLNLDDLATALGVPKDKVAGMTTAEVDEALGTLQATGFSRAAGIQAQLNNPEAPLSDYQRAQLEQELQTLYDSGLASAEQLFGSVLESVRAGELVKFNGKQVKVEDLLKDEEASQLLEDAVTDPTVLERLLKDPSMSGFAGWIQKNQGSLKTVLDVSGKAVKSISETQAAVNNLWEDTALSGVLNLIGVQKGKVPTRQEQAEISKVNNAFKSLDRASFDLVKGSMTPQELKNVLFSSNPKLAFSQFEGAFSQLSSLPEAFRSKVHGLQDPSLGKWTSAWNSLSSENKALFNDPSFGKDIFGMFSTPEMLDQFSKTPSLVQDLDLSVGTSRRFNTVVNNPKAGVDDWLNLLFSPDTHVDAAQLVKKVNEAKSNPNAIVNKQFIDRVRQVLGSDVWVKKGSSWDLDLEKLKKRVQSSMGSLGISGNVTDGFHPARPDGYMHFLDPKDLGLDWKTYSAEQLAADTAAYNAAQEEARKASADRLARSEADKDTKAPAFALKIKEAAKGIFQGNTLSEVKAAVDNYNNFLAQNSSTVNELGVGRLGPIRGTLSAEEFNERKRVEGEIARLKELKRTTEESRAKAEGRPVEPSRKVWVKGPSGRLDVDVDKLIADNETLLVNSYRKEYKALTDNPRYTKAVDFDNGYKARSTGEMLQDTVSFRGVNLIP